MPDEIFGPILPIVTVQSLDDAIAFVNARPKPLGVPVHQGESPRERVIKEVPAGGMLVNHLIVQFATPKLPFGGVGPSGMGAYHGSGASLRGVQPPQDGADQANPTRFDGHDLPAVYREGVEAGAQALLNP